jgi:hypothetical protein
MSTRYGVGMVSGTGGRIPLFTTLNSTCTRVEAAQTEGTHKAWSAWQHAAGRDAGFWRLQG